MNARRRAFFGGLLFAVINIVSFVGETYEHRDHAWQDFGIQEFVLVCAGPITFVIASIVGLKHAQVAGQWMIFAGLLSAVMFILRLTNDPATLLAAVLIWIAPLLIVGCLWLRSAGISVADQKGTVKAVPFSLAAGNACRVTMRPAMSAQPNPLDSELAMFEAHRRVWAREHTGEFVLLFGDNPPSFHPDYESALKAGLRNFGVSATFLIKQVFAEEPVFYIY